MKVLVLGGGGNVGEFVLKKLADKGHEPVSIAQTENRAEEMRKLCSIEVIVANEKEEITDAFVGCEAIIYLTGSNPIAGEERDILVDYNSVVETIEEAKRRGIKRFIYLSAVRVDESDKSKTTGAKNEPEKLFVQEDLHYTIVRSSLATNIPGEGTIKAANSIKEVGKLSNEDLASVLVEILDSESLYKREIEITGGETPIGKAMNDL